MRTEAGAAARRRRVDDRHGAGIGAGRTRRDRGRRLPPEEHRRLRAGCRAAWYRRAAGRAAAAIPRATGPRSALADARRSPRPEVRSTATHPADAPLVTAADRPVRAARRRFVAGRGASVDRPMSTATATVPSSVDRSSWRSYLQRSAIAYLVSRVCVIAGAAIVAAQEVAEANRDGLPRPK